MSTPLDAEVWVTAQDELLGLIRERVPADKWVFGNTGRDFPAGSPFPRHLNGYLLENFLGEWGLSLEEGLASAERALETTSPLTSLSSPRTPTTRAPSSGLASERDSWPAC